MTQDSAWDLLTEPSPTKKVRWFAKSTDRGNIGGIAYSADTLRNAGRMSEQGWNCYVTLNPTNERICKRISVSDVTHWAFLLIDVDPPKTGPREDWRIAQLHEEICLSTGMDPAYIYSGNGMQFWLRFCPRPCESIEARNAYTDVNRGFLHYIRGFAPKGWRIDMTSDLARIARMPGTINQRTGGVARIIAPGKQADYDTTKRFIHRFYKETPHHQTVETGEMQLEWTEVRDDLTLAAKTFIDFGAPEGGRHRNCHHTCRTLKEHGVSRESALEALRLGNEACIEPLSERDVQGILQQVYGEKNA